MSANAVRLYPRTLSTDPTGNPFELPADEVYRNLELPDPPENRPQVLINAVSSIDGRVAAGGKSAGIGSPADRATMRNLRSHVDAVLIGAGSLRAEKMDLSVPEDLEPLRLKRNLTRQPTAIILSNSADLTLKNLVNTPNQEIHTLGTQQGNQGKTIEELLRHLRHNLGIERLLIEGGPRVNHAIISAGCLDELFLTLAPVLLAGEASTAPTLLTGQELKDPVGIQNPLKLSSTYLAGNEIFLHYSTAASCAS